MSKAELLKALKNLKVQTGSLACLGCGYEHGCSTKGCAIIRAAVEELEKSSDWMQGDKGCCDAGNKGLTMEEVMNRSEIKNLEEYYEVILELKQLFNKLCACKDGNTSLLFQMALLFSRLSLTNPNELRRKWFRKKEFSILIWKKEMQRIAKERRGLMSQVLYDIQASPTIDPETIPTEQRPKLRIGSSVYFVVRDNNWRVVEEKVTEIGVNGFFVPFEKGGTEPNDYIPYADIGNEWFLEKEEAEQMAKTRKAEKMCCNCAYWDDIPFDGGCTCKQSEYYSKYPNETDSCNCFNEREENA